MKIWVTLCRVVEIAMRLGRVPDRHGQVWQKTWFDSRKKECTETLVVIDEPFPLGETAFDRLVSERPMWLRSGWVHKAVEIESGNQVTINEKWFGTWSEDNLKKGVAGWKRLN